MNGTSIEMRLNKARQGGTVIGFALNRAKEEVDIRHLLNEDELALVNEAYEQKLQQAKQEKIRIQADQAERWDKERQYEQWCATLPQIGVKVADFCRRSSSYSLGMLYTDLRHHGISIHKYGNRLWVTLEDAERYLVLIKCRTRTGWSQSGRSVLRDAQPIGFRLTPYGDRAALYEESQTRPKRKQSTGIAKAIDDPASVLAAVFSVNRSAKRYRDAASSCYEFARHRGRSSSSACHGLARINSQKKEKLYRLKDAGLVHAVRRGWLEPVAKHGSLTVYRGDGYCFHSLLSPIGWAATETSGNPVFIEQKPRTSAEMRLKDAVATLEALSTETDGFEKAQFPQRSDVSAKWRAFDDEDDEDDGFDEDDEFDDDDLDERYE